MDINDRFEQAKKIVDIITKSNKIYFEQLVPTQLEENLPVVYVIYDKNTDSALYVGRTKKLRRRLYTNHLQGNKSTARLKKYIVEDNINFPNIHDYKSAKEWIKNNCYFQYVEITNSVERGHVEGLIGFILESRYIEDEH